MLHNKLNMQTLRGAWNTRLKWTDFLYKPKEYFAENKHTLPYYPMSRIPRFIFATS